MNDAKRMYTASLVKYVVNDTVIKQLRYNNPSLSYPTSEDEGRTHKNTNKNDTKRMNTVSLVKYVVNDTVMKELRYNNASL